MQKSISIVFILGYFIFIFLTGIIIIQQLEINEIKIENTNLRSDVSSLIYKSDYQQNRLDTQRNVELTQNNQIKILTGRLIDHQNFTIFIGDSITAGGNWQELFPAALVSNYGVPGDSTGGVLNRSDDVIFEKPDRLFIMLGINELMGGGNISAIAAKYDSIIRLINSRSPTTKIYIMSVLPVNQTLYNNTYHNLKKVDNNQVIELNKQLLKVSENYSFTNFIDIYPYFVDQQSQLQANLTNDGLHLNSKGYRIWADLIGKYMN